MNEFTEFVNRIGTAGFGTLMALILYGSFKGIWVWGKDYRKLEAECDRWMEIALRNTAIAATATRVRASVEGGDKNP